MNNHSNKNNEQKQNISEAKQFLNNLDESNNQFTFAAIQEPKPEKKNPKIMGLYGTLDLHSKTLKELNDGGCGVYAVINETDGRGRKTENITKVRAVFVDLDGSPLDPILDAPLEPHFIIETSPKKYHVYWIVDGMPIDQFPPFQSHLARLYEGDPSVSDLPQLMRLPGFFHRKEKPFLSKVIKTSGTQPYSYERLCKAFQWSPNMRNWHQGEDFDQPEQSAVLGKLKDLGLIKALQDHNSGRWLISCPWSNEHTTSGEAYYFEKPNKKYNGEGFLCFHAHCKHRNIQDLRSFLGLPLVDTGKPMPLFREPKDPEPFPIDSLGPTLKEITMKIHQTVKAPIAMIAQSVLASASLVTQGHANIEIDGRTIALSLYFISVAESGERKSAIDDIILSPILDWQKSLWDVYRVEQKNYKSELEKWNQAKKHGTMEEDFSCEPIEPIQPIILIEEPTYEGLVKYLEHGQPSIGLFSDEGGRFLGGNAMNRDNILKTLAGLSSLWDAKKNKPITRVRSGDKSLSLYGRRVALHLMTQESVYSRLNEQSLCESQGFLPRCLITLPESMAGKRMYVTNNPLNSTEFRKYKDHCNALLDRKFPIAAEPSPKNELDPPSIKLDQEARNLWVDFHDALESNLGYGKKYHAIRRFGSKCGEHAIRIAGVLALFEDPETINVTQDHMSRAISIMQYYLTERIRLDCYCCIEQNLLVAQKVIDWARSKQKSTILLTELYQCGPSEVRSKDKAILIMNILEDHGWAFQIPGKLIKNGARGKAWYIVTKEY